MLTSCTIISFSRRNLDHISLIDSNIPEATHTILSSEKELFFTLHRILLRRTCVGSAYFRSVLPFTYDFRVFPLCRDYIITCWRHTVTSTYTSLCMYATELLKHITHLAPWTSPSWEANNRSANNENSRVLHNPKFLYLLQQLTSSPVPSQNNSVHTLPSCIFKTRFNTNFHVRPGFSRRSLSFMF
jgi:hypothetical protein